jgi:UDP-N-acetyl-2-amino-2-deoxyglucuronate dehydrogenase
MSEVKNFALTGAAGYVAPRHLNAIRETGNRLVAAVDPHDAVGVLDRYFRLRFFTEIERFDRHLEKLRRRAGADRVDYVSICSPNYLHDAHIRLALRVGAHAICEKPLVINPWNLDALQELERETGGTVSTVLQLRLHPRLIELRDRIARESSSHQYDVSLTYVTARGRLTPRGRDRTNARVASSSTSAFICSICCCGYSGRSQRARSTCVSRGGSAVFWNWPAPACSGSCPRGRRSAVARSRAAGRHSFDLVDGEEVEFTEGFADLHTRVYEETLARAQVRHRGWPAISSPIRFARRPSIRSPHTCTRW